MPCYLLANINVLEDDFTKTLLHVSFGSMSSTTIPLSEFDGESSTKDAFSDVLKSMVQKIFTMGYPKCSSLPFANMSS